MAISRIGSNITRSTPNATQNIGKATGNAVAKPTESKTKTTAKPLTDGFEVTQQVLTLSSNRSPMPMKAEASIKLSQQSLFIQPNLQEQKKFFEKLSWEANPLRNSLLNDFFNKAKDITQHVLNKMRDTYYRLEDKVVSAAQKILEPLLGVEPEGRKLTDEEKNYLRDIYGDSIDYDKVLIKQGNLGKIEWIDPHRPFVVGNTIYVPSGNSNSSAWDPNVPWDENKKSSLVHEMMHVWQNQNGGIDYAAKALIAQLLGPKDPSGNKSRGYYYEKAVAEGKPFEKLNPEQQAELIQDAFKKQVLPPTNPPQKFLINGVDYSDYVLHAWDMIKKGEGAP